MSDERQRALVIEDDLDIGQLITHYLQKAGFEPALVANGAEGLARARLDPPDVIILDVMLPGLDGLAVCRARNRAKNWDVLCRCPP